MGDSQGGWPVGDSFVEYMGEIVVLFCYVLSHVLVSLHAAHEEREVEEALHYKWMVELLKTVGQ